MLTYRHIAEAVERLVREQETRNPEELCRRLDIRLYRRDLEGKLKGFFVCFARQKNIVIDNHLNEVMERILIAHELGHAVLHQEIAMMKGFQEPGLLGDTRPEETEANLFAAELLLEDQVVLDKLEYLSFFQTAEALCVPAAFLDYKFMLLSGKGYALRTMELHRPDILKENLHAYDGTVRYEYDTT